MMLCASTVFGQAPIGGGTNFLRDGGFEMHPDSTNIVIDNPVCYINAGDGCEWFSEDERALGFIPANFEFTPDLVDRRNNQAFAPFATVSGAYNPNLGNRIMGFGEEEVIMQTLTGNNILAQNTTYLLSGDFYIPIGINFPNTNELLIHLGTERGDGESQVAIQPLDAGNALTTGRWYHFENVQYAVEPNSLTNRFSLGLSDYPNYVYVFFDNLVLQRSCQESALMLDTNITTNTTWGAAQVFNPRSTATFEAPTIWGELTIGNNSTLNINSVEVIMGSESRIRVQAGATLNLNSCTLRTATTADCGGLWQGIIVEAGGTLNMTSSQIQDARIGIDYQGGGIVTPIGDTEQRINISGTATNPSRFDRNITSVRIANVLAETAPLAFRISNTTFNHNALKGGATAANRIGVQLSNARLFANTEPNGTGAIYFTTNTFNGGTRQVDLFNATFDVRSSTFINASENGIFATTNQPNVRYKVVARSNTFTNTNNVGNQIEVSGGMEGLIQQNAMTGAGVYAILYQQNIFPVTSTYYTFTVFQNNISNFGTNTPVPNLAGIALLNNNNAPTLVDRNIIAADSNASVQRVGILANSLTLSGNISKFALDTRIGGTDNNNTTGNQISGVRMGVACRNVHYALLNQNVIRLNNANVGDRFGIWLEWCRDYGIIRNTISQNAIAANSSAIGVGTFWSTTTGAVLNNPLPNTGTNRLRLRDNSISNMNAAFVLGGDNFSSRVTGAAQERIGNNTMTNCTEGFRLVENRLFTAGRIGNTTIANGTIGQAVANTFTNTPSRWVVISEKTTPAAAINDFNTQYNEYNQWYPNNWCDRVVRYFYTLNGQNINIPTNSVTTPFILRANTTPTCPIGPSPESTVASMEPAAEWNARYFEYQSDADTTVLNDAPKRGDRFMRRLIRAEKLLYKGRYAQALQQLNQAQPEGIVENNHKTALTYFIRYRQTGKLNAADIVALQNIAAQNPRESGTGVNLAQSLLALHGYQRSEYKYTEIPSLENPNTGGRLSGSELSNIVLYPNPATTQLNVAGIIGEANLVLINALTGQTVLQQNFQAEESISLQGVRKGLYFYAISTASGVVKKGTLSVE